MPTEPLMFQNRAVAVRKAAVEPDFSGRTVLVSDPWEFVDLWLRRNKQSAARHFWQQAREFYNATLALPPISSPLTAYYCFLNAAKTLLSVKGVAMAANHGVSGRSAAGRTTLANETVTFQNGGVFGPFRNYLGEQLQRETHSLRRIFYNLPFIHRTYTLTYRSDPEIFLPLVRPHYVRNPATDECWFVSDVDASYANSRMASALPADFERDAGAGESFRIRNRPARRFHWGAAANAAQNLQRLTHHHARLRRRVVYIRGTTRLWYLKSSLKAPEQLDKSTLILMFAAMHRLSELSRYDPVALARHFDNKQNWLLSEFIELSPKQFVDEIASEITGQEFMIPGIAAR